ncbi:MarR family winged helix-turn-helix transcriptional regulator [Brenneria tiliae]|uniref:MarR family transcriptional regulator n=1 Tax=Brenneria tiliae TaxID=2914984 RepID=A0ABT0MYW5_9GAMM|nr:MarR family transcriptional regulator [Brenneria tiliae]MCL2895045.1 MarR family transcriptional regulator [Brenneria tiliae]
MTDKTQSKTNLPASEDVLDECTRLAWMLDHLHGLAAAPVFQRMATTLRDGEMSFSQLNALYRLYRNGPQTIADMARGAAISHNAASRMVEGLVQGGLVERHESQSDRRQKRVELTAAGAERLRDLQIFTVDTYAQLLTPVPACVLRRLFEALEEVSAYLPVNPMFAASLENAVNPSDKKRKDQ